METAIGLISRDNYYLSLAFLVSLLSKDTTKVGAVAVMDDGTIFTGYNGLFPKGNDLILQERPLKYSAVIHAEINCLNRAGLERCRQQKNLNVYTTFAPCAPCTSQLVNHGVKRVVYASDYKSQVNDTAIADLIRRKGFANGEYAFELVKYDGPLEYSHSLMGTAQKLIKS
jgi:dCMP deaminase